MGELTAQAVSARNFYCNVQPDDGKVLALSFMFRGKQVESKDVDQVMQTLQQDEAKQATQFVDWIPNNIKSGICKLAGEEVMCHQDCEQHCFEGNLPKVGYPIRSYVQAKG